jgi:ParB family chromosome partitioning protein
VSQRVGKSPAYISNTLRLLALPDALKDGLLTGMITEGHARALAAIEDPHLMIEAYKIILRESGSVRSAEELARRMRSKSGQAPKPHAKTPLIVNEEIDQIRDSLLTKLGGDKVNTVKLSRSRTETKLIIHLKGNVEQTDQRLKLIYESILSNPYNPSESKS